MPLPLSVYSTCKAVVAVPCTRRVKTAALPSSASPLLLTLRLRSSSSAMVRVTRVSVPAMNSPLPP